jgi:Cys-rich protein (TIGR01571 family)
MGRWRDGICDCFTLGWCHAHCCLAFCCKLCALGQVMTRMKLNPYASPMQNSSGMSAFKFLFVVVVAYCVLIQVGISGTLQVLGIWVTAGTYTTTDPYTGEETDDATTESLAGGGVGVVRRVVGLAYAVFFLFVATLTRAYIRRKYRIPEGCCGPCDDFCCSFWCGACSVCQMARHTADYATYPAACCTETGLLDGAPEVV